MRTRNRLVVCFDGTWNRQDNSTNVLQHYNLVWEGYVPSAAGQSSFFQEKYYHRGVGTNPLDRISGGAFGIRLEQNVRDGYNWLVAHYDDGGDPSTADEIYVFGFSRGAYTARSLVGFIASCGLLKRAAPLTVTQLWDQYCLLGRLREVRRSYWEFLGPQWPRIRRLNELVFDPWTEEGRRAAARGPTLDQLVAGQRVPTLTEDESLLVLWSRRVPITYLGIYDTVGAIGLDALAIPGLTSRLALHNNVLATTLIGQCRHALAIDEQRSNFQHTPFVDYIPHAPQAPRPAPLIEQRWFIGAHSNVGGGDANNELTQRPFRWVLEGACQCGLVCHPVPNASSITTARPSDSYAEFGCGVWANLLCAKRHYRTIDPEPELRASRGPHQPPGGFSLKNIYEELDDSVLASWRQIDRHPPPNLVEYARRKLDGVNPPDNGNGLGAIANAPPSAYRWFAAASTSNFWIAAGSTLWAAMILVLWSALAALGLRVLDGVVCVGLHAPLPLWFLGCLASLFTLVDGLEGQVAFSLVLTSNRLFWTTFWKTARGCLCWLRATGVVFFILGGGFAIVQLAVIWLATPTLFEAVKASLWILLLGLVVALPSGLVMGLALGGREIADERSARPPLPAYRVAMRFVTGLLILLALAALAGWCLLATGPMAPSISFPSWAACVGGLLLLLQIGAACGLWALRWVREPLFTANLKPVTRLQFCSTPTQVENCFEQWRSALAGPWDPNVQDGPAARALRTILAEGLWRDALGFIPLYFLVLTLGLWFAARQLSWHWLSTALAGCPLWLWLPLGAALCNYSQDLCHGGYLVLHARGKTPSWPMTIVSFILTLLKFLACAVAVALTFAAILGGTWRLANDAGTDWRGTIVFLVLITEAIAIVAAGIGAIWGKISRPASPLVSPPETDKLYLRMPQH